MESQTHSWVEEYYSKVLKTKADLKTSACCAPSSMPEFLRPLLANIHEEVASRFYGCGTPIPQAIEGASVLDLGCGTGRDCFILASLVGPSGKVVGIDMTDSQLEVAHKHRDYHAEKLNFQSSQVEFKRGFIEDLRSAGIQDNQFDLVISNCVINLSPQKEKVIAEIFRVLKPGGELYFSDVFSDRRLPQELSQDPVLVGECLGGALYVEDFRRICEQFGFKDPRVIESSEIQLFDRRIREQVSGVKFYSKTYRCFKLKLEDRCEDYGQVAYYQGSVSDSPDQFVLDDHHLFPKNYPVPICGNTAAMLSKTRFKKHFKIVGDQSTHFGLFDCGPVLPMASGSESLNSGCC